MIGIRSRTAVVLVGALVVQVAIVPHLAVGGHVVDVMLLMAVVSGLIAGPDRGLVVGFMAGLGTDLIVGTPFGLWTLVGCLMGFGVGTVYGRFVEGGRIVRIFTVMLALATGTALFVVIGRLLGQEFLGEVDLIPILLTVSVGGAILAPLAIRALAWAFEMDRLPWEPSR